MRPSLDQRLKISWAIYLRGLIRPASYQKGSKRESPFVLRLAKHSKRGNTSKIAAGCTISPLAAARLPLP